MWPYIIAAARRDTRHSLHTRRRNTSANRLDDQPYSFRDGRAFTLTSSGPHPGPSGSRSRSKIRVKRYYSRSESSNSPKTLSPVHLPTQYKHELEAIEPFDETASEEDVGRNWMQKQFSKVTRNLRYRISGEGHSKTPDWFLDKFAAQTFTDPEGPLYQAKRSKLFCGLRLAFDPTLPGHYHQVKTTNDDRVSLKQPDLLGAATTFLNHDATHEDITSAGNKCLAALYGVEKDDSLHAYVTRYLSDLLPKLKSTLLVYLLPKRLQLNIPSMWLAVVSLAILYNMVFVIGRAVFWELDKLTALWFVLDYLCDAIYLIDTVVHVHEGYLEQGLMVKDSKMLRTQYLKSVSWRYDFISLIPTDIAYYWWRPGTCDDKRLPCPVIVRLNRLFRLPRMWEWFDRTETATSYPNAFRICKVVMAILVLIHWNACLYFAISYAIGFGSDNWVYNITGARNETLAHQYIYSFYWSTLTLTTIGETPQPEIDAEYLFVVADFLAGVLIFATIVGNIGSMISNMNVARVEFQNKMDGVKQYMAFRKVSGELEARVIRWFAYTWAQSGALDEEHVLSSLPDKLKAEIAIRVHLDTLRKVRIFQDCEPGLLEALVLKLKLQVFSPGDYICRKGDVGKEMYIVKRGRLQVVADDGKTVLATLSAGSVFGEVSVLEIAGNRTGNRRTANVRALGYSDLFCLAKRDLWEALADYPDARATLTERGCQLLRKDGLLDEAVFENAQTTQQSMEETVHKLETTVDMLNNRLQGLLTDVGEEQAKIKQRMSKIELRVLETEDEDTDSDDMTSLAASDLRSDIGGYSELPMISAYNTSMHLLTHPMPVRERGHSLSVERSSGLLNRAPEPRSKSLRLKRNHKDTSK